MQRANHGRTIGCMTVFSVIAIVVMMGLSSARDPLVEWQVGDEVALVGHSFDDEYWSGSFQNTTAANEQVTFDVSYVNFGGAEAFLLALHDVKKGDDVSTIPYQMFGLHYYTAHSHEVFIGAMLAFLMVYNDTNANNLPDASEDRLYVIPFGIGEVYNGSYAPIIEQIPAQKLGTDHYRFGMRYTNLYALATPNPLATAALKTGWLVKFSELQIVYDVKIDRAAGKVSAETFYTVGEVTDLWAVWLGIPFQQSPADMPDTLGLAAVHYVTIFTSKYEFVTDQGLEIDPSLTAPTDDIAIDIGDQNDRAFEIGFRGTYDLLTSEGGEVVKDDAPAYNILLGAKPSDLALVLWQLGFSAGAFSIFAYSLSDYIQATYTNPRDLAQRSLNIFNPQGFYAAPLWYAVCFPAFEGYRVEHDPVYTAYVNLNPAKGADEVKKRSPGFEAVMVVGATIAAVVGLGLATRRRR